ncbi:HNH endonuclease [Streptomyces sp. NPDC002644]
MSWSSSNRRSRLPSNWPALRARVIKRDGGVCQSCGNPGTDVDHVRRGDDHRLENLQLLCGWCHKRKTAEESRAARADKPRPVTRIPRDKREDIPDVW